MNGSKIVVLGGGSAGISCVKVLSKLDLNIHLIDSTNHFLYTPFLFDLPTSFISLKDIVFPFRSLFLSKKKVRLIMKKVTRINKEEKKVFFDEEHSLSYDYLILDCKEENFTIFIDDKEISYNTLFDLQLISEKILHSLEKASFYKNFSEQKKHLTYAVIGTGLPSIELVCALTNIFVLLKNYPHIDKRKIKIYLIQETDSLLPGWPEKIIKKTLERLTTLGITIICSKNLEKISSEKIVIDKQIIEASNIFYIQKKASLDLAKTFLNLPTTHTSLDHDFSLLSHPEIFVIGQSLFPLNQNLTSSPFLKAQNEGKYVGKVLKSKILKNSPLPALSPLKLRLLNLGRFNAIVAIDDFVKNGFAGKLIYCLLYLFFLPNLKNLFKIIYRWLFSRNSSKEAIIYSPLED